MLIGFGMGGDSDEAAYLTEAVQRTRWIPDAAARFAQACRLSDEAIVSNDLNSTSLSWNAVAERMFGYEPPSNVPLSESSPMTNEPPVVAIFNTSPDTVQMLRYLFEQAGLVAVAAFTYEIRDGEVDLESFMRQHRPQAIVYDIAPPYEVNWRLFQHLRSTSAMRNAQYVLTSTNAAHVQKIVGPESHIYEFVGKPYDLDKILEATQRAIASSPAAAPSSEREA